MTTTEKLPRVRTRYEVRTPEGVALSRHQTRLDALDAIARLTSRAAHQGRPVPDLEIWDSRDKRTVAPLGEDHAAPTELSIELTREEGERLREIAAEMGAQARSGRYHGRPSVAELVRLIAAGRVEVRRAS